MKYDAQLRWMSVFFKVPIKTLHKRKSEQLLARILRTLTQEAVIRKLYLAFVMLFLAAISLAVRGSGRDVGMEEFCEKSTSIVFITK